MVVISGPARSGGRCGLGEEKHLLPFLMAQEDENKVCLTGELIFKKAKSI